MRVAKDPIDPGTLDAFPKKRGRPVSNPEKGPMSAAERMAKARAGRVSVEVKMAPAIHDKLKRLAEVAGVSMSDYIVKLIAAKRE